MGTHQETYRRFQGQLGRVRFRFWPVTQAGLRVATKKKAPLFLLLAFPLATMFIFSFLVYTKYAAEEGTFGQATGFGTIQRITISTVARTMAVKSDLANFHIWSRFFSLLILAWYGAGLFSDDRRSRAHLLYFSRPLTKIDYVLGKFLTVFLIGSLSVIVPGLAICVTAVFSSPEWSFLLNEYRTILATLGYGVLWVTVLSVMVLAISSLLPRKSFALVGVFAVVAIPNVFTGILKAILAEPNARFASPWFSLRRIGDWMLDVPKPRFDWPVSWSFAIVGIFAALCCAVIWWRMRRLEVVG